MTQRKHIHEKIINHLLLAFSRQGMGDGELGGPFEGNNSYFKLIIAKKWDSHKSRFHRISISAPGPKRPHFKESKIHREGRYRE